MGLTQRNTSGIARKRRPIWIALICVSFLMGNRIASLTGNAVIFRAIYQLTDPVCGLAGYSQQENEKSIWREVLLSLLAVPIPLLPFSETIETTEKVVTATDPIYDRYQSSEVLFNGGGVNLPENNTLPEKPTLPEGERPGENADKESTSESDPTAENEKEQPGETVTHLPASATGKLYTKEQLKNFTYLINQLYFVHDSTTVYPYQLNIESLLSKDLTIEKTTGPQILIHHTHGTEGFADTVEGKGKTILEVGDYLTELLTSYGYTVLHDRTIYPYDTAYSEAGVRVRRILTENPSIQLVIDLHRDATASQAHRIVTVNGETMAPLMFFNGMCQTADGPIDYLNNPYLQDNLALSLQMKLIAEAYYPGLTRPNFLKAYQYNQHLLPQYTLIEAGFDTNTFEEVCRAMVPLANILDAVLSDPDAVVLID